MSDYILSATLELRNRLTGKIQGAAKGLGAAGKAAGSASAAIDRMGASMGKAGAQAGKLGQSLSGLGRKHTPTVALRDMASPVLDRLRGKFSAVDKGVTAVINARDSASAKLAHIKGELSSLTGKAHSVIVNVQQRGGIQALGSRAVGGLSGVAGGMLMGTGMQMMGAAGIGYGIYDTINAYKNYTAQMSRVYAIAGAGAEQRAALDARAKEMGAATKFSATEAGQALEYMAMAGWKTDQMIAGLPGIMDLAAASGESLGTVSDIVTDAMTAFGMGAGQSGHFADVLARANTNVALLGESFKYAAPIAGALKYSVEDVSVALGLMANQGIKGSESGTALRSVFTRLVSPPKQAAAALDKLNIQAANADGSMKPFRQTLSELRAAFAGMADAEKTANAEAIAGKYAMSGFLAMMNATEEDVRKLTDAVGHAGGASAEMARIMSDNLAGNITGLASVWEAFQISLMEGPASGGLRGLIQTVRDDLRGLVGDMEDGLGLDDLGRLGAKVFAQLCSKFLQMDGIGSLLAGGTLAYGAYRGYGLGRRAYGALRDLYMPTPPPTSTLPPPASTPPTPPTMPTTTPGGKGGIPASGLGPVGSMVVNATSVTVNGKGIPGPGDKGGKGGSGTPGQKGRPGQNRPSPAPTPVPGRGMGAMLKSAAAGGALTAAIAAADLYATKSYNDNARAEADWGVEQATANLKVASERLGAVQKNAESTSEDMAEATRAYHEAETNLYHMQDYRRRTEQQSSLRTAEALGGAAGSVVGGAIGMAVAGPAGAVIGSVLGDWVGTKGGRIYAEWDSRGRPWTWNGQVQPKVSTGQGMRGLRGDGESPGENSDALRAIHGDKGIRTPRTLSRMNIPGEYDPLARNKGREFTLGPFRLGASKGKEGKPARPAAPEPPAPQASPADSMGNLRVSTPWGDKGFSFGAVPKWLKDFTLGDFHFAMPDLSAWKMPELPDMPEWLRNFTLGDFHFAMPDFSAWEMPEWMQNFTLGDFRLDVPDWSQVTQGLAEARDSLVEGLSELGASASEGWEGVKAAVAEGADGLASSVAEALSGIGEGASAAWASLQDGASAAWGNVCSTAAEAKAQVQSAWAEAPGWLDSTVWQPISSAVGNVKGAIVNAFSSAWSAVTGIWGAAAGWFEANVIAPIKAKISAIASIASSLGGGGGIPGLASGTSRAAGGWTEVNEHGGEIIDLPEGSRVYPHATTMNMLRDELRHRVRAAIGLPGAEAWAGARRAEAFPGLRPAPQAQGRGMMPAASPLPGLPGGIGQIFRQPAEEGGIGAQARRADGIPVPLPGILGSIGRAFQKLVPHDVPIPPIAPIPPVVLPQAAPGAGQPPAPNVGQGGGAPVSVTIRIESMNVRENADIDRIAYKLQQLIAEAADNYNFVEEGV